MHILLHRLFVLEIRLLRQEGKLSIANVGDNSSVYLIRDDKQYGYHEVVAESAKSEVSCAD